MPAKKQINIRVSDLTEQQLDALAAWWGTSITETVTVLVDRAYQQEAKLVEPGGCSIAAHNTTRPRRH